jgi:hypothetical protein
MTQKSAKKEKKKKKKKADNKSQGPKQKSVY